MRTIISYTAATLLLIVFQYFLPWWSLVIPCIAAGYLLPFKAYKAFLFGFLMVFITWLGFYLYINHLNNDKIATDIALLFHIPGKYLLFGLCAVTGGLIGGLSSLLGANFKTYRANKGI
jgi:hypothetical protein